MEETVRGFVGNLIGVPPEETTYVITGTAVFVVLVLFSFSTSNSSKQVEEEEEVPLVQPKAAVVTSAATAKKARTNKKKKKRAAPVVVVPPPVVVAAEVNTIEAATVSTKKKNKKKNKKTVVTPPPVVEPEPEPVVVEKKEVPPPPPPKVEEVIAAPPATKKSKKKKKKKAAAAAAAAPPPVEKEDDPVTTDDDADLALSSFANTNTKKKKQPTLPVDDEGEWSTVPTKSTQRKASAATSTESTITLTLSGPEEMFLVLGPQGTTIQQIQSTTGAQLTLDKTANIVYIAGQNAQDAANHIRAILADHTVKTITYPNPNGVKAVIGKSGLQIQNIQTTTGCQLHANLQACSVTITGPSLQAVEAAEILCQKAVYGETQATLDLQSRAMVLAVCGTNFAQLQTWQKETGARLEMSNREDGHVLTIRGDTGPVQQVQKLVKQRMAQCSGITVQIPKSSHVGSLIGSGGTTLRKIQDQSGAFLEVGKTSCQIIGEPAAVAAAKLLVDKRLSGQVIDLKPGEIQVTMELGVAAYAVIGRGGSTIAELEKTHGVKLNVQEAMCSIVGLKANVPQAQDAITVLIAPILEKEAQMAKLRAEQLQNGGTDMWAGQNPEDDEAEGW